MCAYRVVVSREEPWWVAVAHGDGLPAHGAATETRTIADLEEKVRDLIVLRTNADLRMPYEAAAKGLDLSWSYDLPPNAAAALREYQESKGDLAAAQARYAENELQAASVLKAETRASIRDVAALMGISHQRVHQLLARLNRALSHGSRIAGSGGRK